jgi:hypothetical protein
MSSDFIECSGLSLEKITCWPWIQLKEGIGLRGYGQRDPLVEYKKSRSTPSNR